jgi:hypothetical protein
MPDDPNTTTVAKSHLRLLHLVGLEEVEALHRVVGTAGEGKIDLCAQEEQHRAFEFIAPFRMPETIAPINSDWRPPVPVVSLKVAAA